MKTTIISTVAGFVVGAGLMYFMHKPPSHDISQSLVSELPGNTVVASYNGGEILAKDLKEEVKPHFEKTRDELLGHYKRAAEKEFARRHADRLKNEDNAVSDAELSNYMKANKIPQDRTEEIRKFLGGEKQRIQGQLSHMKLMQDLNFQNKLGAATFDVKDTDGMAIKGSGKVTVQVFCDFGNPLCNRSRLTMEGLLNQYKDSVRWVYRHYPVASNQIGDDASLVSLCALEQNMFWPVHDAFYNEQAQLQKDNLVSIAERAGANPDELKKCLQSERPQKLLQAEKNAAQSLGLDTTPVYFINGLKVTDPEKVAPTVQTVMKN